MTRRILALNGSPRGRESATQAILDRLSAGAEAAGASVETVFLHELDLRPCRGCFHCWVETPGRCVLDDDMTRGLLERWRLADLVILGGPLYHYGVCSTLKRFIERTLPSLLPQVAVREGRCVHPDRWPETARPGRYVLVAACGFPERIHFGAMIASLRLALDPTDEGRIAAFVLRPAAETLRRRPLSEPDQRFLDAAFRAGRELADSGRIAEDTRKVLDEESFASERFAELLNRFWETELLRRGHHAAVAEARERLRLIPPVHRG